MKPTSQLSQFKSVDEAADPSEFVRFLELAANEAKEKKQASYHAMGVADGHRVLDVGCGSGVDVEAMAEIVGPTGLSVGVDSSQTMIDEAQQRTERFGSAVEYRCEDAHHLSLDTGTFDSCRAERIIEYVDSPTQVISEMVRVLKPKGKIVVAEPDWGTMAIDVPGRELTQRIAQLVSRNIANDWVGRELPRMFANQGLLDIEVVPEVWTTSNFRVAALLLKLEATLAEAVEAGELSEPNAAAWLKHASEADRAGEFFVALTFFRVAGRKPLDL